MAGLRVFDILHFLLKAANPMGEVYLAYKVVLNILILHLFKDRIARKKVGWRKCAKRDGGALPKITAVVLPTFHCLILFANYTRRIPQL
jgi:hypothetical protein